MRRITRISVAPGPAYSGFSYSVLDDVSQRWHRAIELKYNTYDEALEAMTNFMKHAWTTQRRHVAARVIGV